jgi:ESCRT-II complex subunit
LSEEGKIAVIGYLIKNGNAEWDDAAHTSIRIILKTPETLAGEIYIWVKSVGLLDVVYTIYELVSSEEYENTGIITLT